MYVVDPYSPSLESLVRPNNSSSSFGGYESRSSTRQMIRCREFPVHVGPAVAAFNDRPAVVGLVRYVKRK